MSTRNEGQNSTRPVWMFMVATAMATTVSTLAATAMVQSDSAEALEVTCDCEVAEPAQCEGTAQTAPAPEVTPAAPTPTAAAEPEPADQAPAMSVEGALDKRIIRRVVRAHINEIRYCYNEGLSRDPDLEGRVEVRFTIGPTGKVPVAVVAQSSLDDEDVAGCMAAAVKRWKFPKPPGGGNAMVTYPFVLEPG